MSEDRSKISDGEWLRDFHHARGNRFGQMASYHEDAAKIELDPVKYAEHVALAEKWRLGQHCEFSAASAVAHMTGVPEYGEAWNRRLTPDQIAMCAAPRPHYPVEPSRRKGETE